MRAREVTKVATRTLVFALLMALTLSLAGPEVEEGGFSPQAAVADAVFIDRGRLTDDEDAANGGYGIDLTPYDAADGSSQVDVPVSACQRITESGQYYLTTGLEGAPIEVSVPAELFPAYTGSSSLDRTCIEIAASNVTLDCQGYTLTGAGEAISDTAGIYIAGSAEAPLSDVTVEGCQITAHQFGLYAGHLEGGQILNNQARRNSGIGFYLTGLSDVSVSGNTAERNSPDGVLVVDGKNVTVSGNLAFYNRMRGITFEHCQDCTATGNTSHSDGVLGFAIYGSQGMTLEQNVAYNNRYHGFAILHEAGSAVFRENESYQNDGTGFYLEGSQGNHYADNVSRDNDLDGIAVFKDSSANTFEGNTLRDNGGYGAFSDAPIDSAAFAGNTFSGNALGETGSSDPESIDWCTYTGFGPEGPCDPVFKGGPNLKDPETGGPLVHDARIVGDPLPYPAFGDLWMPTWADDDRLFLTWGDGTGFGDGYPVGYPAYDSPDPVTVTFCEEDTYLPEEEGYFPCWLWCNIFPCGAGKSYPTAPLADAGVLAFEGPLPEFTGVSIASIDVPSGEPFFLQTEPGGALDIAGRNDKPSSLLSYDGRLYLAGHSPAGQPVVGYVAYSDDSGQTWTEVPDSPWGESSNFRVLMFINMGQDYALNEDGYVYALGVGTEASWITGTVHLARVPQETIADYAAYEYFTGIDGDGPHWSASEAEATPLEDLHTTGQASALYHEGIGRYLMLSTDAGSPEGPPHAGALFEAPYPWGPWRRAAVLCFLPECDDGSTNPAWTDGKYIAGLIPKDAGPNHVYFTIAGGDRHYQLQIGMLEFETDPYRWKSFLPLVLKQ